MFQGKFPFKDNKVLSYSLTRDVSYKHLPTKNTLKYIIKTTTETDHLANNNYIYISHTRIETLVRAPDVGILLVY